MKKIIFVLLTMLLFITNIKADDVDIKISEISILEKGNYVETNTPSVNGLNINFNVKFNDVSDYVKYKVVIKNNEKEDYSVSYQNISSDHIKYVFDFEDGNKILKANSEKVLLVTISYDKPVSSEELTSGKYTEEKTLELKVENSDGKIVNPKTGVNEWTSAILSLLVLFGIIVGIIVNNRQLKLMAFTLSFALLLVPYTVDALKEITINITSKIEIEHVDLIKFKITSVSRFETYVDDSDLSYRQSSTKEYDALPNMTMGEWINSKYNIDKITYEDGQDFCSSNESYFMTKDAYRNPDNSIQRLNTDELFRYSDIIEENKEYYISKSGSCDK